jgi:hypothetical protein
VPRPRSREVPLIRHALIPALLALAGCGAGGGFQQEFVDACTASSNLGEPVCRCMAGKAEADLSSDERELLLAVLREDDARAAELRSRVGMEGAVRAGLFMTHVAGCAVAGQPS